MLKSSNIKKVFSLLILLAFCLQTAQAGINIVKSNGITLTGADGINFVGTNGITLTGADGFLSAQANGITLTGADGITLTGADGITLTGADGAAYTGTNGITLTGADGITLTGADGITLTGADGITLTGADGVTYRADSIIVRKPNGITLTGADGITLTGADGITLTGADGITLTGADGITLTGADGITLTGADGITGFGTNGLIFDLVSPTGITLTGADGITLTGADGITLTGADGITLTGADGITLTGADGQQNSYGLQSVDPDLAILLNQATDDSNFNAVVVFHQYPTAVDIENLRKIGIAGGTQFRRLPMIYATATRDQLIAVSQLGNVRSIYGNRTLRFDSDPFFNKTQIQRVALDKDLQSNNSGMPVSGRNVTVAVLDTGVNSQHSDLAGKVVQNVRLNDVQSAPLGFVNPVPVENLANTDLTNGHGTFVAGVIAASGVSSGGKYNGVAPGAKILGLSAGDLNLTHVLAGFDYILERGAGYNVRVVNCSFSADTVFDINDPVNVATKMLTENKVNVVFSAGNKGAGNGTLNPYAVAPWVVSVGATDEKGNLADFSSRGSFGNLQFSPSLVAPGVNVVGLRSAVSQTGVLGAVGSDTQRLSAGEMPFYTTASGTSFSAPQVAGAIALMLEANPNLSPAEIKDILRRSATPLTDYYSHEVGAGMLNSYAAVLEAAFPARKTGVFRSVLTDNAVRFVTSNTQTFSGTISPNSTYSIAVQVPANTIQSSVSIAWGGIANPNDLALRLYDGGGNLRAESNYLNLTGLTGKREKVTVNSPDAGNWQATVRNSFGAGTTQSFLGAIQTTRVEYGQLNDIANLSAADQAVVQESLRKFLMSPEGRNFRPEKSVSREDLAATLVRSGRVPQFVALAPLYLDVKNLTARNAVESAQANPTGKLFFDANSGGLFRPNAPATKLVTAVALVKAANLESSASTATLPLSVADAGAIPSEWRGYAAVALQKGWLQLDGNYFNPNRSLTRLELARAITKIN
jgi:serine protease AprX